RITKMRLKELDRKPPGKQEPMWASFYTFGKYAWGARWLIYRQAGATAPTELLAKVPAFQLLHSRDVYIYMPTPKGPRGYDASVRRQPVSLAVYDDRVISGWRPRLAVGDDWLAFGDNQLRTNFQIGWFVKNKVRKPLGMAARYPDGAIQLSGTTTALPPVAFYSAFPAPTSALAFVGPIRRPLQVFSAFFLEVLNLPSDVVDESENK